MSITSSTFCVSAKYLRAGDEIVTHNGVEVVVFVSRVMTHQDYANGLCTLANVRKVMIDTNKQPAVWTDAEAFVSLADDDGE